MGCSLANASGSEDASRWTISQEKSKVSGTFDVRGCLSRVPDTLDFALTFVDPQTDAVDITNGLTDGQRITTRNLFYQLKERRYLAIAIIGLRPRVTLKFPLLEN